MLAQIAIYTAACFLNDTCPSIVDDTSAMTRKGNVICMLETHLRTTGSTTDEAIAGVMQLILNEWYWGGRKELEAHLGGLREMVRSRGGLANLGLGGLLAKLIIMYCYPDQVHYLLAVLIFSCPGPISPSRSLWRSSRICKGASLSSLMIQPTCRSGYSSTHLSYHLLLPSRRARSR